ncbi:MAG: SMP-30/gluconolactonase/LRE family protein [Caldimonas sp.]
MSPRVFVTPRCVWDAGATLGEGTCWSARSQALWWVDITGRRLHRYAPVSGSKKSLDFDETISAVAERRDAPGLIITLQHGFALFDPATHALRRLQAPEAGQPSNRFNDGKCDAQGRFWAGTMDASCIAPTGVLYRYTASARLTEKGSRANEETPVVDATAVADTKAGATAIAKGETGAKAGVKADAAAAANVDVAADADADADAAAAADDFGTCDLAFEARFAVTNGPTWSADGRTMYFNDTVRREVGAHDFDPATGRLSNPRTWLRFAMKDGHPDGMTTDAAGRIWIAHWGAACVTCHEPASGGELLRVALPTRHITNVAFGGADLDTLYITSARSGLDADQLRDEPLAGGLFAVRTDAKGCAAHLFAG